MFMQPTLAARRLALTILLLLLCSGCASLRGRPTADYIEPTTGMEFIHVRGGTFMMGYPYDDSHENERPLHKVTVSDLFVGMYEVTFDQYDKFCEATNRPKPSDEDWDRGSRPVINVSWEDATAFAEWLSKEAGREFSLPSEAQWEYFSQASMDPKDFIAKAPGHNLANCDGCGSPWDLAGPAPVGTFPPNARGLYDTAGNVNEWCLDHYHENYTGAPDDDRPWLSDNEQQRIHRGGNWSNSPEDIRSYARDWAPQNFRGSYVGFRLIMAEPKAPAK